MSDGLKALLLDFKAYTICSCRDCQSQNLSHFPRHQPWHACLSGCQFIHTIHVTMWSSKLVPVGSSWLICLLAYFQANYSDRLELVWQDTSIISQNALPGQSFCSGLATPKPTPSCASLDEDFGHPDRFCATRRVSREHNATLKVSDKRTYSL